MMEAAWRAPARTGARPDWVEPFARTIDAAKKYVVSSTLDRVDWNAELVRGDLGKAVQQLKRESGKGLLVGGVKLPLALAELGLIDEYEFLVQPRLTGHGPTPNATIRASQTSCCGPSLSSCLLSRCIDTSASVECSTITTAQLPERRRSSFWTLRPTQLNRGVVSCKLARACKVCAVVPKPAAPRIPKAGVNEMSDSVPKRLYR